MCLREGIAMIIELSLQLKQDCRKYKRSERKQNVTRIRIKFVNIVSSNIKEFSFIHFQVLLVLKVYMQGI